MNSARLTLKIFLVTITCFLLSYASSVLGNLNSEKNFPHSLFTQYTKSIGNNQRVEIEKKIDSPDVAEIMIETSQTDIELSSVPSEEISIGLKGSYFSKNNHPESVLEVIPQGSKLIIRTHESDLDENSFFHMSSPESEGKLIVSIPSRIKNVRIKSVSGDINIGDQKLTRLELESVSGDTLIRDAYIEKLEFRSVSGGIAGRGTILVFAGKSISGGGRFDFSNLNPVIEFKSTSGDFQALFASLPNISLQFSTISGSFQMEHEFGTAPTDGRKVQLTLGTGLGKAAVNTISGDFKIGKLNSQE